MKNVMPVSKAKTAYGLLSEIRRLILEEPKRYDQTDTVTFLSNGDDFYPQPRPACGTVGCVAGWTCVLKIPHLKSKWQDEWVDICQRAEDILGLNEHQASRLFSPHAAKRKMQTAEHAKRGAAHIARFQEKYAAQLKAKRV